MADSLGKRQRRLDEVDPTPALLRLHALVQQWAAACRDAVRWQAAVLLDLRALTAALREPAGPAPAPHQLQAFYDAVDRHHKAALPDVWTNCLQSLQRRYPHRKFGPLYDAPHARAPREEPRDSWSSCAAFGCKRVAVTDAAGQRECLQFIAGAPTVALGAQTALVPVGGSGSGSAADLIQVGDGTVAFIISPQDAPAAFTTQLRAALGGRTVLHWGLRNAVLARVEASLGGLPGAYAVNVQHAWYRDVDLSTAARTASGRALSKAWMFSGWDLRPLTPGQLEYAALHVALVFRLWERASR